MRLALRVVLTASAVCGGACTTIKDPVALVTTLRMQVRNSDLGIQSTPEPALQVTSWQIDEMTLALEGPPGTPETFSLLPLGSCQLIDNALARSDFARQCGGETGVVLGFSSPTRAVLRMTVSRMEGRRAERPSLPLLGDYDGDGIANFSDSCKLVPNADQNPVGTDYTACALLDSTTQAPVAPDQDLDKVQDLLDDCLWIPNPAGTDGLQTDANRNGIGDVCERAVPILMPASPLRVACAFEVPGGANTAITVDFGGGSSGRESAVECDASLSSCVLRPERIVLAAFPPGSATLQACAVVP